MRVAIVGAAGQVGSEVSVLLSAAPGVQIVPIARSRSASAFLRHLGISVAHGDITDHQVGRRYLANADVVANLAIAGGTPAEAREQDERVIRATFEYSKPEATIVFFSTLAVHGSVDVKGRWRRTEYSDLKRRNERLVQRLSQRSGRSAFVLRLGHVAGPYQAFTQACRSEIVSGSVLLPEPERASNVAHTVTVADALLAIGQKRCGAGGLYDLVNIPQWTWREVYAREAADLGVPLLIERAPQLLEHTALGDRIVRHLTAGAPGQAAKTLALRWMALLSPGMNARVRAEYYVSRVRNEIGQLYPAQTVKNPAALWPAIVTRCLPDLRCTADLLAAGWPSAQRDSRTSFWAPDFSK